MLYSLDDYTLDAEHYELRQAGRVVRLAPRVFNLVAYLALHATAGHHFNSQTPGACRPEDIQTRRYRALIFSCLTSCPFSPLAKRVPNFH
jgi:hypothetical protein